MSTAGGLVFGGTEEGNFFALNAETGQPLWDTQIGGNISGIPMSFAAGILVSLVAPEPSAAAGYAALERRMHLGDR